MNDRYVIRDSPAQIVVVLLMVVFMLGLVVGAHLERGQEQLAPSPRPAPIPAHVLLV